MDWLKDKKNQPIVAAALAVIIIGGGVAVYFTMFAGGSETPPAAETNVPATTAEMGEGYATDASGTPGMPGAPGTAPGTVAAAPAPIPPGGAVPMEAWRGDPFLPAGYKPPPANQPKPRVPIRDFPFGNFSQVPKKGADDLIPDLPQPVRRMAGLIESDRIYAIIETNGVSQIVQPGDMLDDRLARVERIERDRVILKTMDRVPKQIVVRLTSAARTASNITPATTGTEGPPSPMGPTGRPGRFDRNPNVGEPMMPM